MSESHFNRDHRSQCEGLQPIHSRHTAWRFIHRFQALLGACPRTQAAALMAGMIRLANQAAKGWLLTARWTWTL